MRSLQCLSMLWCVFAWVSPVVATDEAPWPIPRLVQYADLIVVGSAVIERDGASIQVTEFLKGESGDRVAITRVETGAFPAAVFRSGDRGVFFLRGDGAGYAPFTSASFLSMDRLDAVREGILMAADPGPFLDVGRYPENTDILYVLSERFTGWTMTSEQVPELSWPGPSFWEVAPWSEKHVVTLQCTSDPQDSFRVRVTSAEPDGPLGECVEHRLLIGFKSQVARQALPTRFSVTLDARVPERAGSATREQALKYVRDRLGSAEPNIIVNALRALARMRDLEAVPRVLLLLEHNDERIRQLAIQFLGWSRDERAADPLGELLEATAPRYPEDHAVSDASAAALTRIGLARSVPTLERAAALGVYRACEGIGAIGNTASFEAMLEAFEADPQRCAHVDFALYWLVRRSNRPMEEWMTDRATTQLTQVARLPQWRRWWQANRVEFDVIKSQELVINETIQQDE